MPNAPNAPKRGQVNRSIRDRNEGLAATLRQEQPGQLGSGKHRKCDSNVALESTAEVRIKGINFTTALDAIQRLYGPAARQRIEKETSGDWGDALRFGGIVVGGWYPIAWYRSFWKLLRDKLGVDEAAARRIGHCATGIGVNIAYRTLARMSSPALILSMSARAFNHYFAPPASLFVKQPEPKRLTAEWSNCNGFDRMIWSVVEGGATFFIEATGVAGVDFSVIAGGGPTNYMLATATWR